jgi:hypothetical protein
VGTNGIFECKSLPENAHRTTTPDQSSPNDMFFNNPPAIPIANGKLLQNLTTSAASGGACSGVVSNLVCVCVRVCVCVCVCTRASVRVKVRLELALELA